MRLRNRKGKRKWRERLLWAQSSLLDHKGREQEREPPEEEPPCLIEYRLPQLHFPSSAPPTPWGTWGQLFEQACPQLQTCPLASYNYIGTHLPPFQCLSSSDFLLGVLSVSVPQGSFLIWQDRVIQDHLQPQDIMQCIFLQYWFYCC